MEAMDRSGPSARRSKATAGVGGLLVIGLIAASCAKAPATPGGGGTPTVSYPAGANQLILRVALEGGFISPTIIATRLPQFSLYGDGTVITEGAQDMIYPGQALPPILSQKLTADGIQAVLEAAVAAGLASHHGSLGSMGSVEVSDLPTTVFTFNADGVTSTLSVYGLGAGGVKPPQMKQSESQLRAALAVLTLKLGTLEQWLPQGSISTAVPFAAHGSRVYVSPYRPDQTLTEPAMAWPLAEPLDTWGSSGTMGTALPVPGSRCGVVQGSDWTSTLAPLAAKANVLTPWKSAGTSYGLSFRPLLPDESGC
jgi:hypothetical protein